MKDIDLDYFNKEIKIENSNNNEKKFYLIYFIKLNEYHYN